MSAAGGKARTPTAGRPSPQNRTTPSSKTSSNSGSDAGCGAGEGGGGAGGGTDSSVRVVVRVRPQSKKELEGGHSFCVSFPSQVIKAGVQEIGPMFEFILRLIRND